MEDISRTIDALSSMIAVNNKRFSAYQSLADKAQQHEIRTFFRQLADQSKRFAGSLATWRAAYGGFGVVDKKPITNTWSQVKYRLGLHSDKNMIDECEQLEQEAVKIYKSSTSTAFMPPATVADIQKQLGELERSLSKLRFMKTQSTVIELVAKAQ